MKKYILSAAALVLLLSLVAFVRDNTPKAGTADKIFTNGKIITVDAKNSIAQAVAVKDGKIVAVGTVAEVAKWKGSNTEVVDLQGKTLTPGFIDGHSHFMGLERSKTANIAAPPVGTVKNIADIIAVLQQFKKEKNIAAGEWISAFGYDQDQLQEKRHPTKEDLDAAFPDNPVTLTHVSGHMTVANSLALKLSDIDAGTPDPAGGVIVRVKGSKEPAGLLQESASRLLKRTQKQKPTLEEQLEALKDQQLFYASNGITTAQDGYSSFESVELLGKAAERKELFIDIEALPGYQTLEKVLADPQYKFGILNNHLKLAGTKLVADGSPQGKTAFFTKAYLTEVPGCNHDECVGFANVTQQQFNEAIIKAFQHNIRPFVHCNGDATIDMYIKAIDNADKELHTTSNSRRPVTIHSQFVRPDQLDEYKRLGIIPALFSNHAFFWGDVHVQNLGEQRASFLSPLKTAGAKGLHPTNHTDYGVTPLNQLFLLWTSVARESRSGKVIGAAERLTPIEGLRAITINGAYEYFEENLKGSIEPGKLADLVILSDDITAIAPAKIKDVTVLETIKEGKTIYKK
ncbi:MAG: amidohydrolase [Chitinophagaceae bacterium]